MFKLFLNWNLVKKKKKKKKKKIKTVYPQKYDFAIFVPKIYTWQASQFSLLQKQFLCTGKRI